MPSCGVDRQTAGGDAQHCTGLNGLTRGAESDGVPHKTSPNKRTCLSHDIWHANCRQLTDNKTSVDCQHPAASRLPPTVCQNFPAHNNSCFLSRPLVPEALAVSSPSAMPTLAYGVHGGHQSSPGGSPHPFRRIIHGLTQHSAAPSFPHPQHASGAATPFTAKSANTPQYCDHALPYCPSAVHKFPDT